MTDARKLRIIAKFLFKLGIPDCEVVHNAEILLKKLKKPKKRK